MTSLLTQYANLTQHHRPAVGDMKMAVVKKDHTGWLMCDGRALNTDEFWFLFQVIGYSFGGSGNSFNLPDPAGRVPGVIGTGTTPNLTPRILGAEVGEETHTLTIAEMPSHNHGVATGGQGATNDQTAVNGAHTHTGTTDAAGWGTTTASPATSLTTMDVADNSGNHTHTFTTNSAGAHAHTLNPAGGDQPHNNMQPTLFMGNMFIYSGKPKYGSNLLDINTNLY